MLHYIRSHGLWTSTTIIVLLVLLTACSKTKPPKIAGDYWQGHADMISALEDTARTPLLVPLFGDDKPTNADSNWTTARLGEPRYIAPHTQHDPGTRIYDPATGASYRVGGGSISVPASITVEKSTRRVAVSKAVPRRAFDKKQLLFMPAVTTGDSTLTVFGWVRTLEPSAWTAEHQAASDANVYVPAHIAAWNQPFVLVGLPTMWFEVATEPPAKLDYVPDFRATARLYGEFLEHGETVGDATPEFNRILRDHYRAAWDVAMAREYLEGRKSVGFVAWDRPGAKRARNLAKAEELLDGAVALDSLWTYPAVVRDELAVAEQEIREGVQPLPDRLQFELTFLFARNISVSNHEGAFGSMFSLALGPEYNLSSRFTLAAEWRPTLFSDQYLAGSDWWKQAAATARFWIPLRFQRGGKAGHLPTISVALANLPVTLDEGSRGKTAIPGHAVEATFGLRPRGDHVPTANDRGLVLEFGYRWATHDPATDSFGRPVEVDGDSWLARLGVRF